MRRYIFPLVLAALFAAPAMAQRVGTTVTTFANLPSTCDPEGQAFVVTDANATCTAGGGSVRWCFCDSAGTGYDPQPGGTPDPNSVDSSVVVDDSLLEADLDLVDTPSDEDVLTYEAGAGGDFEWHTIAELTEAGAALADLSDVAGSTGTGNVVRETSPTIVTPTIADQTNMNHNHSNAAGGGDVALGAGSTATTPAQGDDDTSVATSAFVMNEIRGAKQWGAFDVFPDNSQCGPAFGATINSGPVVGAIECADNASSIIYGQSQDELYDGGTLVFTLMAVNENATPSGILDFDFSCMCRGNDDLLDATWGTAQNASITFATQYDIMHADTTAVTCNDTCTAGDTMYWRAVMDATATTTQVADTKILGFAAREQ